MNVIELVNNNNKKQQQQQQKEEEEEDPTTDNTVVSDLSKLLTRTHHHPPRRRRRQRRRSVVNIKLSIDDDAAAAVDDNNNNIIQSGDHIGIYPINDPISVQRAMDWLLGLSSPTTKKTDTTTTTTMIILRRRGKNDNHKLFDDDVPQEISCYEFLSKHVNINGKATSSALFALIPYCGTLELRALARELTYVDIIDIKNHHQGQELLQQQQRGEQQQQQQQVIKEKEEDCTTTSTTSTTNRLFHDWVGGRKLTVLDLTIMFECRPSIQGFAKICGPIHPRLYSIMDVVTIKTNKSGNNNNKNNEERCCPTTTTSTITTTTTTTMNINLCVAVDPDGLCSNYLAQRQQSLNHRNVKKSSIHDDDEEEDPMDATTTTTKTKQPDDDITTTTTNAINVFFQKSKFHYVSQDNSNIPSILVAAGSGIGVCLGFIQNELDRIIDRQQKKKKVLSDDACSSCSSSEYVEFDKSMDIETDNAEEETINDDSSDDNNKRLLSHLTLFFGCRDQSELLYRDRLVQYQKLGLNLHIAYSRETRRYPKCYVQDLIRQMGRKVWNDLKSSSTTSSENDPKQPGGGGGYVYVCGRLELLEGVKSSLLDVARTVGELDNEGANSFVRQLEASGRIKTDCWSVANNNSITVDAASNSQWPHRRRPHVPLRLERHHDNNNNNNNSTISKHCSPTKQIKDLSRISKWPSYLRLLATGELEQRVNRAMDMWSACVACGRNCETDRLSSDPKDWGECRVGTQAIVSSAFPHFGEEDCLRGTRGSGTIFFGACNLQCCYCQNWDISANDEGVTMSDEELAQIMLNLQWKGCHNINFVSPTHNVAPILRALLIAAKKGLRLPLVWNTGGYDSVASLRLLDGIIDIYMPDAKYASRSVARRLSKIDNYPEINQAAIKEMHRQVGDLELDPDTGLAIRGVLVRHLILPKRLAGTCDVMSFLAREVSKDTFTNVMDQYRPEHHAVRDKKFGLNKRPTSQELNEAHEEAKVAGLHRFDGEFRHPSYLDW